MNAADDIPAWVLRLKALLKDVEEEMKWEREKRDKITGPSATRPPLRN